jgi:DNA-binding transcriptional LysR family regulator
MNFDLADLRAFVAVAELGSFHAAADTLHLSPPALSRRIQKLEDVLGVRLFERTTRFVSLTAVGRELSRKARSVLDDLESSLLGIEEVAAARMGEITVSCVVSAVPQFLVSVLRRFHAKCPNIRVRIMDDGAPEVLSSVIRGEAEFGLNFIGAQEPEIEFEPILREPYVLICHRDDPLAQMPEVAWAGLTGRDYIAVGKGKGNRLVLDLALSELPVRPDSCYEIGRISTLLDLVEGGLGVGVIPRILMPNSGRPALACVPLVAPTVMRTLGLIRKRGRPLSPPAQQLYALIAQSRLRGTKKNAIGASSLERDLTLTEQAVSGLG